MKKNNNDFKSENSVSRSVLKGLDAIIFQHPSDRAILGKLKSVPFLDKIVAEIVDSQKRQIEIGLMANNILVNIDSMPHVYRIYETACRVLSVPEPFPPLFIEQNPYINGYTIGCDKPYICITSTAINNLTRDELLYLLGHELGHILCQHVRYSTLARMLVEISATPGIMTDIAGMAAKFTALPLLLIWSRRAELSADRAGYLACQDNEVVYRAIMKLAGFPSMLYESMRTESFIKQAEEFERIISENFEDNLYSLANSIYATHPRCVERVSEIKIWNDDGSFDDIVNSSEDERAVLAAHMQTDPLLAELTRILTKSLTAWSVREFSLPYHAVARPLRRMFFGLSDLRGTPVQGILRVELLIQKTGVNELKYYLVVLFNRSGKAVRTKLETPCADSWDECPTELRHEFTAKGTKELIRLIYNI